MLPAKFHQIIDIKLILSNKFYHRAPIFPFLLLNIMRKLYKKAKSTQFFNNTIVTQINRELEQTICSIARRRNI